MPRPRRRHNSIPGTAHYRILLRIRTAMVTTIHRPLISRTTRPLTKRPVLEILGLPQSSASRACFSLKRRSLPTRMDRRTLPYLRRLHPVALTIPTAGDPQWHIPTRHLELSMDFHSTHPPLRPILLPLLRRRAHPTRPAADRCPA